MHIEQDPKGGVFTFPKTANSIRVYPLLKVLEPYIANLKPAKGGSPYVFLAKSKLEGTGVEGQSTIRRKAIAYAEKAGMEPIKLHEFRHSCVSNLLVSGLPVSMVARWVGGTERMVQNTYSHLLSSEKGIIKDFFDAEEKGRGPIADAWNAYSCFVGNNYVVMFLRFLDLTFHYSLIFVFLVNRLCGSSPIDSLPKKD